MSDTIEKIKALPGGPGCAVAYDDNGVQWGDFTFDELRSLADRVEAAEAKLAVAKDVLNDIDPVSKQALEIITTQGFVFNKEGGQWEKLAFTFYNILVGASADARHALQNIEETK